jgi:DNA-binding XRE family transcriptional regulator
MVKEIIELKKFTNENYLYQKEIARDLGVSEGTISLWFKGKYTPDIKQRKRIVDYLDQYKQEQGA